MFAANLPRSRHDQANWLADKHRLESATEASERIERAVNKAHADGIKPTEFGGANGAADIARAVLAAL
jgi:3-isopropylmalate dehydrogenase